MYKVTVRKKVAVPMGGLTVEVATPTVFHTADVTIVMKLKTIADENGWELSYEMIHLIDDINTILDKVNDTIKKDEDIGNLAFTE